MQSHASTSVRIIIKKMPNTVCGHTEILHTLLGMGSAALVAAVPYSGKRPGFLEKG